MVLYTKKQLQPQRKLKPYLNFYHILYTFSLVKQVTVAFKVAYFKLLAVFLSS